MMPRTTPPDLRTRTPAVRAILEKEGGLASSAHRLVVASGSGTL